ncbi:hypothetical protein AURDEDRAFT_178167 [Auricularia subglabra TFB-10046 SS5]|uniref:Uncharacterized protein n=1 Tax=Auricularia subglabra (strain TFB-10046 / SS5) TaxID=717982 RepID=J0CR57_AURST|nr:hypothetical protein AURDEDRAFT_178167 [Auricularia subglabra TFB-10046 SS5]
MPDNSAHRRSFMRSEDDDDEHECDEDDTARLSDDRRKPENEPERSVQRVKSLSETDRLETRPRVTGDSSPTFPFSIPFSIRDHR